MRSFAIVGLVILTLVGCRKHEVEPDHSALGQPLSAYGLTIDSPPSIAIVQGGDTSFYTASTGWTPFMSTDDVGGARVYVSGMDNAVLQDSWRLSFSMSDTNVASTGQFLGVFHEGNTHAWGDPSDPPAVLIEYSDNGHPWSSLCDGGDQSGSFFYVVEREYVPGVPDRMKVLVAFTFDLYDCDTGSTAMPDVKGSMRLDFLRE